MIKKILTIISLISVTLVYSQEISTKTNSSLGESIAYFIKKRLVPKEELITIKPDEIESVNVIKRDTIVDKKRYSGQIFVVLKQPNSK
jgi:hypothetical protein